MSKGANIEINASGDILKALEDIKTHFSELNKKVDVLEGNVDDGFKKMAKSARTNMASVVTGVNQAFELVDKFAGRLGFTQEINDSKRQIQLYTGTAGEELDKLNKKTVTLSGVYKDSTEEINKAANAMTQHFGGTFEENLSKIEQGYKRGANLNGDMLQQLNEYATHMKEAGITADQTLAVMAQASKNGVYDDKGLDAIKEAGMSIREMTNSEIEALNAIGLKVADLQGLTSAEAIKRVSAAMKEAGSQAHQTALTGIFRGAGEDAGKGFVDGISTMEMDLSKLPEVEKSGEDLETFYANIKTKITSILGDVSPYLEPISQVGITLSTVLPMLQSLGIVTKIVTAAQWLWNMAMTANPIGIIITAIGVLVGGIIYLATQTEWFGEFFGKVWDTITNSFMAVVEFWNTYLNPFNWLLELVDYVFPGAKKSILEFFSNLWDNIYRIFIQPLVDAWNWITDALGFGDSKPLEVNINKNEDGTVTVKSDSSKKEVKEDAETKAPTLDFTNKGKTTTSSKLPNTKSTTEKKEIKSISVNIQNLMSGDIVIKSENMKESASKIRQIVNEALVGAVRDFEVAM